MIPRNFSSVLVALSVMSTPAASVAQTPDTVVEILGLKKWTYQMVQDSLHRYAPGTTIASWACAVILRDSIGFAQASVEIVDYPDRVYRTLVVVEPDQRSKLRPLVLKDSSAVRGHWRGVFDALKADPRAFNNLQDWRFLTGQSNNALGRPADSSAIRLRDAIRNAAATTSTVDAVAVVTHDRNRDNRAIAALILGHKGDDPVAWKGLVRGLLGPSDHATAAADMVLSALVRHHPITVDWTSHRSDLEALLAGTNLFGYMTALRVMAGTHVDPELGRSLAKSGRTLLVANLNSKEPGRRADVITFMRAISPTDFGNDSGKWAQWLESL